MEEKKQTMSELISRSYKAIKDRGLIDNLTTQEDFYIKMVEELKEFYEAIRFNDNVSKTEEATDLMTVCIMYLRHNNKNVINEFEKVVIKNEKRAMQKKYIEKYEHDISHGLETKDN